MSKTTTAKTASKTKPVAKTAAKRVATKPAVKSSTKSSKTPAKSVSAKPRKAAAAKPTTPVEPAPVIMELKTYRVEPDLYAETMRLCKENGDQIGRDILRKAMRSYVKRKGGNTEL